MLNITSQLKKFIKMVEITYIVGSSSQRSTTSNVQTSSTSDRGRTFSILTFNHLEVMNVLSSMLPKMVTTLVVFLQKNQFYRLKLERITPQLQGKRYQQLVGLLQKSQRNILNYSSQVILRRSGRTYLFTIRFWRRRRLNKFQQGLTTTHLIPLRNANIDGSMDLLTLESQQQLERS